MKVDRNSKYLRLDGEDGATLDVCYDNRGDPYRAGATLSVRDEAGFVSVFLESHEVKQLRDLLNNLYPPNRRPRGVMPWN